MDVVFTLDEALVNAGMTLDELEVLFSEQTGLSVFPKRGKFKAIRFNSLACICDVLDCEPGDLLKRVECVQGSVTQNDEIS